jgi:hypothetical protein
MANIRTAVSTRAARLGTAPRASSSAAVVDDDATTSTPAKKTVTTTTTMKTATSNTVPTIGGGRGRGSGRGGGSGVVAGLQFEAGADPFGRGFTNGSRTVTSTPSRTPTTTAAPVVMVSSTVGYASHHTDAPPRSGTAAEKKIRLAAGVRSQSPWRAFAVHCKKSKYDVYVGRANPTIDDTDFTWGNPFKVR